MGSALASDGLYLNASVQTAVKILIVGHFAVGKTTLVGTLSEIRPLSTEEHMTKAGELIDDLAGIKDKTTTTVAMDFGRLTLSDQLVLYLFGAPGQRRFTQLWHDLSLGALGALVLVDTERLELAFDVVNLLEQRGLPYAVAVNQFDDAPAYPLDEVREALALLPRTPLVACDARDHESSVLALIALVDHLISLEQDPE
ncbi:GTP-binding protein [Actinocorallia longicatena]|uniref:ATP/GTP-binding protein n=1 Tax=Actinocorallia longicatena TaxID=111803 RepID=A0ABP6QSV7_9ACTN